MKTEIFQVGIIDTNCYLVTDEETGESLVVDPGAVSQELLEALKDKNIKYILLTHGHYDHILGVAELKRITGADVLISEEDAECLYNDELSRAGLHFPEPQEHIRADRTLSDGDTIKFGKSEIKVLHTPGHTPGCVCYIFENDKVIFSGDTLFRLSRGRTDFASGSTADIMKSLSALSELDGDYAVFPGHAEATTLDFERKYNPYMRKR